MEFYDGDDFHPPENVAKMAAGFPLNDADRLPWLETLHDLIASRLGEGGPWFWPALRLRSVTDKPC